jgi:transcriptional regulator with XRE-family HTH domain
MTRVVEDTPQSFGELLRRFRMAARLRQEELADQANLGTHGISDLERGARMRPYAATVERLANALDLAPRERSLLHEARRVYRTTAIPELMTPSANPASALEPANSPDTEAGSIRRPASSQRLPGVVQRRARRRFTAQSRRGPLRRIIPHSRSRALPLPPAPLIGRAAELKLGGETLRRRDVRLVTLTGVGGRARPGSRWASRQRPRRLFLTAPTSWILPQ